MISSKQDVWVQNVDSWVSSAWPTTFQATDTQWAKASDVAELPPTSIPLGKQAIVKPSKPTKQTTSANPKAKVKLGTESFPVPPSFSPDSFYIIPSQTFEVTNDSAWKPYFVPPADLGTANSATVQPQFNNSWSSPPSPTQSPPVSPPSSPTKIAPPKQTPNPNTRTKRNLDIESELSKQNLYKTELCRSWMETGACPYGTKCQFAHGREELRPVKRHPKYKTEICRTFHTTGTCPYGKRCRFIHDPAERSVAPGLSPMEEDALELDIQRQLAALRLSLENTDGIDVTPVPDVAQLALSPASPSAALPLSGLLTDDEEYENEGNDGNESDGEDFEPTATSVQNPVAQLASKQVQPPPQAAQTRKKSRLPFFQKLLSKKH